MSETENAPGTRQFVPPPQLHWGWVLFLSILTGGLFAAIWMIVIASWVRRVRGRCHASGWTWYYLITILAVYILQLVMKTSSGSGDEAGCALYFVPVFVLREELEAEPIGLTLTGPMTFFFGPIYFQYHLYQLEPPNPIAAGVALHQASQSTT